MNTRPLTEAEYDCMAALLSRFCSQRAMNLEQLDGFFAALICSPDSVLPSEYMLEIWGGDMGDDEAFSNRQELQNFLDLVICHWNVIADTLQSGDIFLPLLLEHEEGFTRANDWARGFMRGVELRKEDWINLFDDEQHGGSLVPILVLAHEHDPDPKASLSGAH